MTNDEIRKRAQDAQRDHMVNAAKHAASRQGVAPAMTFARYEQGAKATAKFDDRVAVQYNALKLAGEAGEIADALGKGLMSGEFAPASYGSLEAVSSDLRDKVIRESGDALWHLTLLLVSVGSSLEEAAEINLDKLADRFRRDVILGDGDHR